MGMLQNNGITEGWLYLIRSNRIGIKYARRRYFVFKDNYLRCYKGIPISERQVFLLFVFAICVFPFAFFFLMMLMEFQPCFLREFELWTRVLELDIHCDSVVVVVVLVYVFFSFSFSVFPEYMNWVINSSYYSCMSIVKQRQVGGFVWVLVNP